jgi:Cu/Zn superoxide dismutase
LKLADVLGRSLVIHETGDDYTDNPENRSAVSPWRLSQELSGST